MLDALIGHYTRLKENDAFGILLRPRVLANSMLYQRELRARPLVMTSSPPGMEIELTNRCNLACVQYLLRLGVQERADAGQLRAGAGRGRGADDRARSPVQVVSVRRSVVERSESSLRLFVLLGGQPPHHVCRRRHAGLLHAVQGNLLVRQRARAAVQRHLEQRAVPDEPGAGDAPARPGAGVRIVQGVLQEFFS